MEKRGREENLEAKFGMGWGCHENVRPGKGRMETFMKH